MENKTILVLGGGLGGVVAATELRKNWMNAIGLWFLISNLSIYMPFTALADGRKTKTQKSH